MVAKDEIEIGVRWPGEFFGAATDGGEAAGAIDVLALRHTDTRTLAQACAQARRTGAFVAFVATPHDLDAAGVTHPTPRQFAESAFAVAAAAGLSAVRLGLALAPLGAGRWHDEPSEVALAKAEWLVARSVEAGFGLVHLDGAAACLDDPRPLPARLAAARVARLCHVAEQAFAELPAGARGAPPRYVVQGNPSTLREAFGWRALAQAAWPRMIVSSPAPTEGPDGDLRALLAGHAAVAWRELDTAAERIVA